MDVGIMIEGQEGLTWERWRRLVQAAEDLGYESLCRSDHLTGLGGESKRPSLPGIRATMNRWSPYSSNFARW